MAEQWRLTTLVIYCRLEFCPRGNLLMIIFIMLTILALSKKRDTLTGSPQAANRERGDTTHLLTYLCRYKCLTFHP